MKEVWRNNLRLNLIFWPCYFLYEWLGNAAIEDEYRRFLINALVIVPLGMLATWFTVHVLIQRFYRRHRMKAFWTLLVISIVIFSILRRSYNYFYNYPIYYPEAFESMSWLFWPKLLIEGVNLYLVVAVYAMFYFAQEWNRQQRRAQALQKAKVEAELQLLKSQVQPHFLFNTLNNIYSHAIRNQDSTADPIYRLSSLLSYMLYDSREPWVAAGKELEYIRNYIELEKIRYGDRMDVSVNVYDNLDEFCISPFLLLPLVENSFKHGVHEQTERSWIRIDFSLQDQWLTVKLENNYNGNEKASNGKNGIGLENVRKQLEILYPQQHEFRVLHDDQSFLVVLKLKNKAGENSMPDSGR